MRILVRADVSRQIGTGHFMRCLTLAEALQERGGQICFLSRELPAHLCEMLTAKGMEFVGMPGGAPSASGDGLAHSHWLGTSQEDDARAALHALAGTTWDWLIVDHYALDRVWETALRAIARQIMVIDDLADRRHDCEVLLDQNFYADMQNRYDGKVPAHCRLLLGPHYALLRDEFRTLRERIKPRTGEVKKILVFFGGVDAGNYTGLALEALTGLAIKDLQVEVVIGAQHPQRSAIEEACAAQGHVCHVQTTRMAELMAAADLAIGAGGSTTWERCCLGLPALSICVADNQRDQLEDAADCGLLYGPAGSGDLKAFIGRHTQALLENPALLRLISATAMKAVDGRGATRVGATLAAGDIEIRTVNQSDSPKLFAWRNHPAIRSVSRNTEQISWENHQAWFASVLADQDRVLLIGCVEDEPVGVVRFDKAGTDAEVSIYLVPEPGSAGQGRNLLLSAEQWLKAHHPEIKGIRAKVLGSNLASQRLFLGANYRLEAVGYLKEFKREA